MDSYIILMQVPIGTDQVATKKAISALCRKLEIDLFLPIDRSDDDSRIDCYVFHTDLSAEFLQGSWAMEFPGRAISIVRFVDEFALFVEKAAEIYHHSLGMGTDKLHEHVRRHLLHYLFNAFGYSYLDEARFYLDCSEKYVSATKKCLEKLPSLIMLPR